MKSIGPISLTDEETEILKNISFEYKDHGTLQMSCANAEKLMRSLNNRGAIPEARMRYFTDPQYRINGRGKSWQKSFEVNGTTGDAIWRDGNFLKYLQYFIYGPDLPAKVIAEICDSDGMESYWSLAKHLVKKNRLDPRKTADELYKLFLECDRPLFEAREVRDAVKSM